MNNNNNNNNKHSTREIRNTVALSRISKSETYIAFRPVEILVSLKVFRVKVIKKPFVEKERLLATFFCLLVTHLFIFLSLFNNWQLFYITRRLASVKCRLTQVAKLSSLSFGWHSSSLAIRHMLLADNGCFPLKIK